MDRDQNKSKYITAVPYISGTLEINTKKKTSKSQKRHHPRKNTNPAHKVVTKH
jgi:hypothetical protein